ncbi:MAG: YggS family pyridoxal phosphate-dependent enzyme [Dehalococcoidia bacterium]|nr:MAG: YggS family pyridoxal phosphate-dependent enzyme [Dehalococcoidia bacterium]
MTAIEERVAEVRERMAAACARAGRRKDEVTLIAVTKGHGVDAIEQALAAGVRDFGENRVREAAPKIAELRARGVSMRWHLIGHLQRNKAPAAIDLFDILHTVDSERLAEAIDVRAVRRVPVLVEVNVAGEATKHGAAPGEIPEFVERLLRYANLDVRGLMTVAPQVDDPEDVRDVFRELRRMRDDLGLGELSMGMTGDFEVAIEEGSTLVRVGRAIFGSRPAWRAPAGEPGRGAS